MDVLQFLRPSDPRSLRSRPSGAEPEHENPESQASEHEDPESQSPEHENVESNQVPERENSWSSQVPEREDPVGTQESEDEDTETSQAPEYEEDLARGQTLGRPDPSISEGQELGTQKRLIFALRLSASALSPEPSNYSGRARWLPRGDNPWAPRPALSRSGFGLSESRSRSTDSAAGFAEPISGSTKSTFWFIDYPFYLPQSTCRFMGSTFEFMDKALWLS